MRNLTKFFGCFILSIFFLSSVLEVYAESGVMVELDEVFDDGEPYVATKEERLQAVNQKVTIFTYHHLLKDEKNLLYRENKSVTSYEDFVIQMEYIKKSGYNTITLKELEDFIYYSKPLPPSKNNNSVIITFDDGYLSNYLLAYPVLKEYGMKASIFHITELLPEESITELNPNKLEYMSREQMILSKDVFEHELHTHGGHHYINGEAGYIWMDKEDIINDIYVNRSKLPISSRGRFFAYPYGQFDNETVEALKDAEVTLAFTTVSGYVDSSSNPLRLNRFGINNSSCFDEFKEILDK